MTDKKSPQTAEDVLMALHEFLLGKEPDFRSEPIEKVREYLRKAGVDPHPTIQSIRKRMAKIKGEMALKAAREKRQRRKVADIRTKTLDLLNMGRDELIAQLKELAGHEEAAVYMRKYENLDEDDLRSLIEDMVALDGNNAEE